MNSVIKWVNKAETARDINSDGFLEQPNQEAIHVCHYTTQLDNAMSVRVQTYVWQLELRPTEKLVAIALADHCHDDGSEARPSQALLARKTGLDERTIRRILVRLLEQGVIYLYKPHGQHRANNYSFNLPDDFGKIRPDTVTPLNKSQGGHSRRQTGHPVPSDRTQRPPNHKEPLLEPGEKLPDMREVRRINREIFKTMLRDA